MSLKLNRRFLKVDKRRVHYLRAGEGSPVVLVHSSPANAWFLLPEIERLARDHTVFAFDTPGFGLSEPLPLDTMTVADLADALAQTLDAIGMPPCPMFGSHSGAAIALEFGVRHPKRVTGLVLDGVPAFTEEECQALFGDYFRKLPVSDLGGHYANAWTRFRDQTIWFPWSHRHPANLNRYDLSSPESTHLWVSMYFDAADTYTPAYYATSHYGSRAIAASAALTLPAIYTATDTDMLFPHMERLAPLKSNQSVRRIGASHEAKRALIAEGFAAFSSPDAAPANRDAIGSSTTVQRQFLEGRQGRQLHLRYAGDRTSPALLLIHDAPGSAAQCEALIAALASNWFVIAPDLPGCGESDAFPEQPTMTALVNELEAILINLGTETADVFGLGFGSSVAAALAIYSRRIEKVALQGMLLPSAEEREALAANYTPPITIEADGGHWYRTWLMLRDSKVWWPWFDRRKATQRKVQTSFDADEMHRWTVDVMRQHASYGHIIQAALSHHLEAILPELAARVVQICDPLTPLSAFDNRAAALLAGAPAAPSLTSHPDLAVFSQALTGALRPQTPARRSQP